MSNSNEAEKKFKYDVFLSHSSKDKPVVRELAERLKADGVRVWFDEWEIQIGDSIPSKIEQGLEESRILILAMSANAFGSDWVSLERGTAMFRDPQNKQRRFIPLRLDDSPIKETLKQFRYVDWRKKDNEEYRWLLDACLSPLKDNPKAVVAENADQIIFDKVLKGHTNSTASVAITADGKLIVSGSFDKTIRVWETESGKCLSVLKDKANPVLSVAITADGKLIVSGSLDKTVRVWETESGKCLSVLKGHTDSPYGVGITADGKLIVSGSNDNTVRVWETESGKCLSVLKGHTNYVRSVAITADGKLIVSGSWDTTIRVWETASRACLSVLRGHIDKVFGVAITADGKLIVSSSADNTVRVWETESGKCLSVLEGHTGNTYGVAITADGKLIVSGSLDTTIRVWDLSNFSRIKKQEPSNQITQTKIKKQARASYTNAKVLLVGDSGVGKSGLAYRLTENKFVETVSTDGAWATQLKLSGDVNTEDTEREIWLWDFAGQSDYRLIHQLFMDETSLAVLVFNPQSDNPFEGLG
ncbi:MAG TPA: TIR domain-containing protein [Pyrinomonadaceae bacterium]